MALMEWNQKYSVGVPAMDTQHQKWFGILNRLHEAMLTGKSADALRAVMSEMVAYTRTHFMEEELMLKVRKYPQFAEHKAKHDAFTKEVQDLEAKMIAGAPVLSMQMMDSLRKWLSGHILAEDVRYGAYLKTA